MFFLTLGVIAIYLLFELNTRNLELTRLKNEAMSIATSFSGSNSAPIWLHGVLLDFEIAAVSYLPFLNDLADHLDQLIRVNRRTYFQIMSRIINVFIIYLIMFTLGYSESKLSSIVIIVYVACVMRHCHFNGKQSIYTQFMKSTQKMDLNFKATQDQVRLKEMSHRSIIGVFGTMSEIGILVIGIWSSGILV
jgi:hypothetical protein